MSELHIEPVETGADMRRFFELPKRLYADDPCYVEPIRSELKKQFSRKKNPFFEHADIQCFLAYRDSRPVGRITAIENRLYNEYHNERSGFFGFFECADDAGASGGLFRAAEQWIKDRGLHIVIGPMSFSTNDMSPGVLIRGFEYPPYIDMSHALPYYAGLIEGSGYKKAVDVLAFKIPIHQELDPRIVRLAERVRTRRNVTVRYFDEKRFDEEVQIMRDIYNSAWSGNWGFVPITDAEFDEAAKSFNRVRIKELALIAEVDGKPAAFSLVLPNINEALIHMKGRLFPFGIFKFLYWQKKIKGLRLLILGIKPEHRKRGIDVMLYYHNMTEGMKLGYTEGELSWVLETNTPVINAARLVKGEEYKRYRIYQKKL